MLSFKTGLCLKICRDSKINKSTLLEVESKILKLSSTTGEPHRSAWLRMLECGG